MISDFEAVRENLFAASHGAIEDWKVFPWHRDRSNRIQAHKAHSSQAIAIDVFGTLKMSPDRDRILDAIARRVGVAAGGRWSITLKWTDTDRLLREPRPTQVDVLAVGSMAALVIEFKFTEPEGKCSQTAASSSGERQCSGHYADQINPRNGVRSRCALAGKGIRHWELHPSSIRTQCGSRPHALPFCGRRLSVDAQRRLGGSDRQAQQPSMRRTRRLCRSPKFSNGAEGEARSGGLQSRWPSCDHPISYQQIIAIACHVGLDQELWNGISAWVDHKIARVGSRRPDFQDV